MNQFAVDLQNARSARWRFVQGGLALGSVAYRCDSSFSPARPARTRASQRLLQRLWERAHGLPEFEPLSASVALPEWVHWSARRRRRYATLIGAVIRADRLARSINGRLLVLVTREIGEETLGAIVSEFGDRLPLENAPWSSHPVRDLRGLGGEALLRLELQPEAVLTRLRLMFPASEALGSIDTAVLRAIAEQSALWLDGRPIGSAAKQTTTTTTSRAVAANDPGDGEVTAAQAADAAGALRAMAEQFNYWDEKS